jgi:hypothetical protein
VHVQHPLRNVEDQGEKPKLGACRRIRVRQRLGEHQAEDHGSASWDKACDRPSYSNVE